MANDVHDQKMRLACLDAATRMAIPNTFGVALKHAEQFYFWVTNTEAKPEITDPPNLGHK